MRTILSYYTNYLVIRIRLGATKGDKSEIPDKIPRIYIINYLLIIFTFNALAFVKQLEMSKTIPFNHGRTIGK